MKILHPWKEFKNHNDLKQRIGLLEKSTNKDSQALPCSHLAKTQAMAGNLEVAKAWMARWKKLCKLHSNDARRWKLASLGLELYQARTKNPNATLTDDQWRAATKVNVTKAEVEALQAQATELGFLYLLDSEDEALLASAGPWKPRNHDSAGSWN